LNPCRSSITKFEYSDMGRFTGLSTHCCRNSQHRVTLYSASLPNQPTDTCQRRGPRTKSPSLSHAKLTLSLKKPKSLLSVWYT